MLWKIIGNEKQYILSKFLGQFKVLNTHIFIKCCMRHLYISLMHLICPPKFCITFFFHFSWVLQPSQKKLKTVLMQNVGDTFKVHYGRCASGVCLAVFFENVIARWTFGWNCFFSAKNFSKVAIKKTKSAKFLFLFSSFLPRSFFFSFLFWSFSGSKHRPFRTLFHSNDCKFRQVDF